MSKKSKPNTTQSSPLQPSLEAAIKAVFDERAQPQSNLSLFDLNFPQQQNFIEDPAKRKALWCTRRAAKSYTGGIYLSETANKYHEVNCLYLGLTKFSAEGIIWNDILKRIDRKHELGMSFNSSKLIATSMTGSMIYVTGIDADADEMQKLLGRKYKLVIVDEAQSYSVDLRALIYGILGPAVVDEGGTIVIMGTSGNMKMGLFYDVTTGNEPGWKMFSWTAHDNPYVARQWKEELDDIEKNRPDFKKTSLYKQWYLNQWCVDEDAKVYRFRPERNSVPSLPAGVSDWHYVLGVDLAHSPDSTAFVVGAYSLIHPSLHFVLAHKQTKMDLTDVATYIRLLETKYKFEVKVCDGANKQAVAELNNRHNLGLIAADKTAKTDFIGIMNDEYAQKKIALLPEAQPLADEYEKLIWITDENNKIREPRKENPLIHNDLCDAGLYTWRFCYQYLFRPKEPFQDPTLQAVWEPKHIERLQKEVEAKQNQNLVDLQWDEAWNEDDDDGL